MLNAMLLLRAMDGIDEEALLRAGDFLAWEREKRHSPSRRKLWRTVLAAALLALLLAACGYAVYRAAMSHRNLDPGDEKGYFFNGLDGSRNEGLHLELNFGDCAMALHFDTKETGCAHAFRLKEGAPIPETWIGGGSSMLRFFKSYEPGGFKEPEQQRSLDQCLREAGMTEEEAERWEHSRTYSSGTTAQRPALRMEVLDGAYLHGVDLIMGWPKGEATVVKEETRGDIQLLEALIRVEIGDGEWDRQNYLLRFDTRQQMLLVLAAGEESMSFAQLEELLDYIELRETGFRYAYDHSGQNFSVLSLAYG